MDRLERPGLGEPLPDPFAAQGEHCGCPGGFEEAPAIEATLVRQRNGERVSLLQHSASSRCCSAGVRGGRSVGVTASTRVWAGTIRWYFVRTTSSANSKTLSDRADRGTSTCSRVPKTGASDGQTVAYMGFKSPA